MLVSIKIAVDDFLKYLTKIPAVEVVKWDGVALNIRTCSVKNTTLFFYGPHTSRIEDTALPAEMTLKVKEMQASHAVTTICITLD